nr:MAG TPA: hypothetical protein [Caudoviricetes sp.]
MEYQLIFFIIYGNLYVIFCLLIFLLAFHIWRAYTKKHNM